MQVGRCEVQGLDVSGQREGGFPGDSAGKESACNAGDLGSIPGSGRSPAARNQVNADWRLLTSVWDPQLPPAPFLVPPALV